MRRPEREVVIGMRLNSQGLRPNAICTARTIAVGNEELAIVARMVVKIEETSMIFMGISLDMIHARLSQIRRRTIIIVIRFKIKLCNSTGILKISSGNQVGLSPSRHRGHQQKHQQGLNKVQFPEIQCFCHFVSTLLLYKTQKRTKSVPTDEINHSSPALCLAQNSLKSA